MHLWTIIVIIISAWILRQRVTVLEDASWSERWYKSLFLLLAPGVSLFSTAIAILYMGCHGSMLGIDAGSWGCGVAASLLSYGVVCAIKLIYQNQRAIDNLKNFPEALVEKTPTRIVEVDFPYSAQIGFWQPQLVISTGMLNTLGEKHLKAVIAHEQAHVYYRDTFWFFWLAWMRSFTFWLPRTEILWQELLLLRELRADSKAAEQVDFLLLAESLLAVAKAPLQDSPVWCANFNDRILEDRLETRINFLLEEKILSQPSYWHNWNWILLLFLPLLTIPLHC